MKNESKNNTKRAKIASWVAVVLPSIVIGSGLLAHKASESEEIIAHEHRCEDEFLCEASPIDFGGISPLGRGDFPFNPGPGPGAGGTNPGDLVYEGPKYTGPNLADYHEQPVFVKEYFRNLRNNFPTNDDDGNCGYVAAAMLLSYYDTCWNSSFVPDVYNDDVTELDAIDDQYYESPGVKDYNLEVWVNRYEAGPMDEPTLAEGASEEEKQAYEEEMRAYADWTYGAYELYMERMMSPTVKDKYIIPHLYTIAHELGIIQYRAEAGADDYDWKKIKPSIGTRNLRRVLQRYFSENGLSEKVEYESKVITDLDDYETDEERQSAFRQEIVEKLKKGQPVMVSGSLRTDENTEGGLHMVIAYEYDEDHDLIYGHTGWKGVVRSRRNLDSLLYNFTEYACLNIKDTLRVSENNYRYRVGDELYESFDLPSHVHNFDKAIHYGYALKHALQCTCGEVQYEFHSLSATCKCGYKRFGF